MNLTFEPITIPDWVQYFLLAVLTILLWGLLASLISFFRSKTFEANAKAYTSIRMTNHVCGPEKK